MLRFLYALWDLIANLACCFDTKVLAKRYLQAHSAVGTIFFLHVNWAHMKFSLVLETRFWTLLFVFGKTPDCLQNYTRLLQRFDHIMVTGKFTGTGLVTYQKLASLIMRLENFVPRLKSF